MLPGPWEGLAILLGVALGVEVACDTKHSVKILCHTSAKPILFPDPNALVSEIQ